MKFVSIIFGLFLLIPVFANAQMIITEIMYDIEGTDTGREWIEVKNTGTEPIDLTAWKLFEANVNHGISSAGANLVPVGGFAIIADVPDKFKVDNPNFSGLVFDSAFSLSNTGETVVLKDPNGVEADSVSYTSSTGAAGNGFTLQRAGGGWVAAAPTIGSDTTATESQNPPASNTGGETGGNTNQENDTTTPSQNQVVIIHSSHSSQEVANGSYDEPELVVTSGRPRLGYVGVPIAFEAKVKSTKNISLGNTVGSTWSMGDGAQKSGQFISHTYEFPGEYTAILNSSTGGASAVSKVKVKIVEPKIALNAVRPEYVEVANLDSLELNIGGWILETGGLRFVIPQDTIISPKSSIKLSSKVTHLTVLRGFVRITSPLGNVFADTSVTGNLASVIGSNGEVAIALPEGVTESALKERFTMISHGAIARNAISLTEIASVVAPSESSAVISPVASNVSTSTAAAAVIYTVLDTPEKSWWGKLISRWKK